MMMKRKFVGALVFSVAALAAGAVSAAGWEEREKGGGAVVYSQEKAGSGVDTVKGIIQLPYTTDEVAKVMTDIPNQKSFVPHMKSIKILKEEKLSNGRVKQLLHQVNAVPVISDRDVVISAQTWSEARGQGSMWRSTFEAITNDGPKVNPDMVRITKMKGHWTIKPTKDGKGSIVVYVFHAEVGGSVPDFVAESGQVDTVFDMLKNLKTRCRNLYGKR
jgi:hypothetical protein